MAVKQIIKHTLLAAVAVIVGGALLAVSSPIGFTRPPGLCAECEPIMAPGGDSTQREPESEPVDEDPSGPHLAVGDVERVIAQAVQQAKALNVAGAIAVVDRVGNVLAVYQMNGALKDVQISSTEPGQPEIDGGLEGIVLPANAGGAALAAIAKAITGAYLSSSHGNALSSRTASQIVQEFFNPGEKNQPSGPLFGVQFSQLACSDFTRRYDGGPADGGPKRSPLGLSADPGGFPLYQDGTLVGGVGVIADGHYSIDKNIMDFDRNVDEMIAFAATWGYQAPESIRANRITIEGKTLRYSDVRGDDLAVDPANAPPFASLSAADGAVIPVKAYSAGSVIAGTVYGAPASGVRPASGVLADAGAFVFVDTNNDPRYPPRSGSDGSKALTENEVQVLLQEALGVANAARSQIRKPLGSHAQVTVSVVDSAGMILGVARTADAPIFGSDVSVQKARTAAFFSSPDAADFLLSIDVPTVYLSPDLAPRRSVDIGSYALQAKAFLGPTALSDGVAFPDRAGGNLSRPMFPDGIVGTDNGPFSKPQGEWSVFSSGLQLDLSLNGIVQHVGFALGLPGFVNDTPQNCVGVELGSGVSSAASGRIANGTQIFPGSVPIYRGDVLVGGIGVSGDGVEQDDLIAFLGLHRAGESLDGAIGNAPPAMRADRLTPKGVRLRYVVCPYKPFLNSDVQEVCNGK